MKQHVLFDLLITCGEPRMAHKSNRYTCTPKSEKCTSISSENVLVPDYIGKNWTVVTCLTLVDKSEDDFRCSIRPRDYRVQF